ncbi:phosphonoacetate hydrolase [Pseudoclavibacter sp. RFBJ3]|uniref:alkaline phosphatase family protein n=1 Tax=unclassified Pseudoclavibacter TaxID=2615177 RepID=UPI000CE8AD8F|nr:MULTISPECIES: alkaline phosphatase family protein [unclassified Pseudoclavibacter]PPF81531.1 phosphonoacetate hydrolase [Pseudoclavibacter sp. RFBJ5]PPF90861.1 phosphonoacetate hydrolase [Pseudoclavibacter sp. RFBJ3]PPG00137.1 phosphonoacetate hydrolase [Pseudoclavibacter sp. RFBH5]PPG19995.1 phosphonoacetate hydrolase [Pseudoclavibacter sp. RFBI4]
MSITVNDRTYNAPERTVVVFTVDGGDPRYFDDALRRDTMPRLAAMLAHGGSYALGASEMPSLTNPNNISIVTGVSPAIHGIPGNYCRLSDGTLELLNDPRFLRAPSIHAAFEAAGVPTLMVTTKDKLRLLLGNGGVPSVSVERAAGASLEAYGIEDVEELVGEPAPGVYEPRASHYAMRIGLAALERTPQLKLIYVSLTDRVQHASAPGEQLSDEFFIEFDRLLGQYLDAGCLVAITADHGMNSKHDEAGEARVVYLEDTLRAAGIAIDEVVLPITDPYTKHHGALGSFAWIYLDDADRERARRALAATPGIEEVWDREASATIYEHPIDRIGDLAVTAAADTALGRTASAHDLTQLHSALRSHGGRYEQLVPLIISEPVTGPLAERYAANVLRSRDIHDLVLNNT